MAQAQQQYALKKRIWSGPGFSYDLEESTLVMGIVNLTPDSFSGDGLGDDVETAVSQAARFAEDGADILDVGGESTRPGSQRVGLQEELDRVLPVIEGIRKRVDAPISIDTYKSRVAREAIGAGASIINDISGFRYDKEMVNVCLETKAACVLMHIKGTPQTMQKDPTYNDLMGEIMAYLAGSVTMAQYAGVSLDRIAVDPGIGFGKTFDHNLLLIQRLETFRSLGCAVLVGPSRKAFIGHLLGGLPPEDRVEGTAAVVAASVVNGADIVRVHDVKAMARVVRVASAIRRARPGGGVHGV